MTREEAKKLASDNYFVRRANAESYSHDRGGYGILGRDREQELLDQAFEDYQNALDGKPVTTVQRSQPTPRGSYVNKPEWNELLR